MSYFVVLLAGVLLGAWCWEKYSAYARELLDKGRKLLTK